MSEIEVKKGATELKKISKDELNKILEEHAKWLKNSENEEYGIEVVKKGDLSWINFDGENLEGYRFESVNFEGSSFRNANLKTAHFYKANLQKTNLDGAIIERAFFQEANFTGAIIQNVNFNKVNANQAKFKGVDLHGINFSGAILTNAYFREANLQNSNLQGARLENAVLELANLQRANLRGADLKKARLSSSILQNANLDEANLPGAILERANLQKASFQQAELQGAFLDDADLRGADLQYTNISGASLARADIKGAKLLGANLEECDVVGVKYNRWARYQGIRVATCYGSPFFKRFAQDQDFIEEFRGVWWRFPLYLLWLIFSDCGRSLMLWAVWSISFAICFGLKFFSLGAEAFDVAQLPWTKATTLYYSVVTFTTLGFGDIIPKTTEAAQWVMAEVILGYIMLGGLISIFATKIARRS